MQIDGVHVALLYRGTREIPAAALSYLYSRLQNMARTMKGSFQQAFSLYVDDREIFCRLFFDPERGHKIDIDDRTCTDYGSFLLWRKQINGEPTFWAAFRDGTTEQIKPLDEQTGEENLAGYEVPPYILSSPLNVPPNASSLYSGQMREVVQCYHLTREFNPFTYDHYATHGVLENPKRDPDNPKVGDYFIIEIGTGGVFAIPVANSGRCCDSWDVTDYLAGEGEPQQFAKKLYLAWNAELRDPAKRPLVYTLISKADITPVYSEGDPFILEAGWAFSASGHEAQQVVAKEFFTGFDFSSASENYYRMARGKISFTVTDDVPSATFAWVERNLKCTFHRPNGVMWVPRFDAITLYSGVYPHANTINNQNAPVYVYYVGDSESVLRFVKSESSVPQVITGSSNDYGYFYVASDGFFQVCPVYYDIKENVHFVSDPYFREDSYTLTEMGFVLTGPNGFNGVGQSKTSHLIRRGQSTLVPQTQYFDPVYTNNTGNDNPAECQGLCSNIAIRQDEYQYSYVISGLYDITAGYGHASCVVIPQFEREGALLFTSNSKSNVDESTTTTGVRYLTMYRGYDLGYVNEPPHPCNNYAFTQATFGLSAPGLPTTSTSVSYPGSGDFFGESRIRSSKLSKSLPVSQYGDPQGPFATVMSWIKGQKEEIQIPTYVIGGGLFYPLTEEEDGVDDPTPEDRFTGYTLELERNGFEYDGQILTFVGRI